MSAQDAPALRAFSCDASTREPWLRIVEEVINPHVPDAIAGGFVSGVGLWDGDTLCALEVWRPDELDPLTWHSVVLAVRVGYRHRGNGRALKEHLIALARQVGVRAIASVVHEDNDPMLSLNVSLGATIRRFESDPTHFEVIIPVRD